MNLRDLTYLIAVAETNHFGRAAERCHVSQPTLSGQIKKLEEELGVTVFERTNRSVAVTPVGEVYVTESFAAGLALEQATDFACEYVGHLPSAKGYGDMRMYLLQDRRGADA